VLVDGRKVSGNAFHQLPDRSIVHGTLLYDTDMEALEEAIRPPVEKLERHGVASVRQRVRNISDMVPQLDDPHEALKSVEELEEYLTGYFTDGVLRLDVADVNEIEKMAQAFEQFDNQ
jgi:lipoate-protein ligase A